MGWWGKAVGGTLGLLVGGPLGAMVGATLGHGVDRGAERIADLLEPGRTAHRARLHASFLETTFAVLGHLAKSDGRVTAPEIAFAESVMARMGLNRSQRRVAIQWFNLGKSDAFDLNAAVAAFRQASADQHQLHRLFLEIQLGAAYMDGEPTPAERLVLEQCRRGLLFSLVGFRRMEQLTQLQQRILGAGGDWRAGDGRTGPGAERPPARTSLAGAYATLGIAPAASDEEVKRAYRKLMSRHHPDKLMSRGLPEQAVKMASQKTHEIRRAYETVTQARGT